MKKFRLIYLCAVLTTVFFGCADNADIADDTSGIAYTSAEIPETTASAEFSVATSATSPTTEIRNISFSSCENVENMSDEDLVYIAKNFVYDVSNDYDFFDIPLEENESVSPYIFLVDSIDGLDVNEPVPDDFLQNLIDEFFTKMISSNNTYDGTTGSRIYDEVITFCGENDLYKEYRISYIRERTFYNNNKLVTNEIPCIYRYMFMKNNLNLNGCPVFFGELNTETAESLLNSNSAIYSEFSETDDDFVFTSYDIHISGGDYGLCDTAYLTKTEHILNKASHIYDIHSQYLKETEIEGTYHEYPADHGF